MSSLVGSQLLNIREKEIRRERRQKDWSLSEGRLKSLRRRIGDLLFGKRLRSMSIASGKFPRGPEGQMTEDDNNEKVDWRENCN